MWSDLWQGVLFVCHGGVSYLIVYLFIIIIYLYHLCSHLWLSTRDITINNNPRSRCWESRTCRSSVSRWSACCGGWRWRWRSAWRRSVERTGRFSELFSRNISSWTDLGRKERRGEVRGRFLLDVRTEDHRGKTQVWDVGLGADGRHGRVYHHLHHQWLSVSTVQYSIVYYSTV